MILLHNQPVDEAEGITDIASIKKLPFVIAGDFNATSDSDVINLLDKIFKRTCQICAPAIPAANPTKAIDFIAYKHPQDKFSVASHKVLMSSMPLITGLWWL